MMTRLSAIATAFALLSAPALSQTGANGYFKIHNDTPSDTVVGFYTYKERGRSASWLSEPLRSGEIASGAFDDGSVSCDQMFQVGWLGRGGITELDPPVRVNICNASNLYLGNQRISFN